MIPFLPLLLLLAAHALGDGDALLKQGRLQEALAAFDASLAEKEDYLLLFKRGTTLLSLGRSAPATNDFDRVIHLQPGFQGAHAQRGKIRLRQGDWGGAEEDLVMAHQQVHELRTAKSETQKADAANRTADVDACVEHAGNAIRIAPGSSHLRRLRAECRLAKGHVEAAIVDLIHLAQITPASDPAITAAKLLFYSSYDTAGATAQLKKCLHFDPDQKECKALFRKLRRLGGDVQKADDALEKRMWIKSRQAVEGLLPSVQEDYTELERSRLLVESSPRLLLLHLYEAACKASQESPAKGGKKFSSYCDLAMKADPDSTVALLAKAQRMLDDDEIEGAIEILNRVNEITGGGDPSVHEKLKHAQQMLRKRGQKNYYKVLGAERDATLKEVRKAYRQKTREFHPDKYRGDLSQEQVERKMSEINEAYEVLSDEGLRARFDNGDDPNSQEGAHPFQQGGNPFAGGSGGGGGGGQHFFFQPGSGGGNPFGDSPNFQFKFNFG